MPTSGRWPKISHDNTPATAGITQNSMDTALLVHAAHGDARQRGDEQPHRSVHATDCHESARACGQHGANAQQQCDHPLDRQRFAEECRRECRRHHGVHRHDHRAQDRRRAVQQRQIQAHEQHSLCQKTADQHVPERPSSGPCHTREEHPCAEDHSSQTEPEDQHDHR